MNNLRLLAGMLCCSLLSGGAYACAQERMMTLDEIFAAAETSSVQLRPAFDCEQEAMRETEVARAARLPEINTTLALSYIGDGFTTRRDFSDYEKAAIPHFGNGLSVNVKQPLYTGGAITSAMEMADLKLRASHQATEQQRNELRFVLASYYLDIYKYHNLRSVVDANTEQAREVLKEMKVRYEQGVALRNDITRYELLLSSLELHRVKIDNILNILNRNLVVTAGLPESTVILPDTTILERSLPQAGEEWWQSEADLNSPALKLARTGVSMSKTSEKLVRSESLPKIGLEAKWTADGPILVEVPPINLSLIQI
ncbi:MAG: TolC family protein [Muribaculaceae bacterium]|nr:TolC family protein [Muribaculaceae bacterium]